MRNNWILRVEFSTAASLIFIHIIKLRNRIVGGNYIILSISIHPYQRHGSSSDEERMVMLEHSLTILPMGMDVGRVRGKQKGGQRMRRLKGHVWSNGIESQ